MESFNPVTISMGKEHGRYYFHFIAGEINVGSKNNWLNKKPMFLSEVEKNLGFRIVFVHYFESILKKENQLLMWHIFSHYPMWLSYPFHPLAWCPSCCTRFRASCPPRNPPRLLQASASFPPSSVLRTAYNEYNSCSSNQARDFIVCVFI